MNDTSPEIREMHRDLLMERSAEDRFRMALSMSQSARALVWASLPEHLSHSERRVQFLLRLYGSDLDERVRDLAVAGIRDQ